MRSVTRLAAWGAIAVALLAVRTAGGILLGGSRAGAPPSVAPASSVSATAVPSSRYRIAACEAATFDLARVLDSASAAAKAGTAAAARARTDGAKAMAMWDTTAKFLVLQGRRAVIMAPEPLQPASSLLVKMLSKLFQAYGEFGASYTNADHEAHVRGMTDFHEAHTLATKAGAILSPGVCDAV